MRITAIAAAISIILVGLSSAGEATAAIRKTISIGEQGLGPALRELAKDRNFQILVRSDLVRDQRTAGASGYLTTDEALTQLLAGTALTFQYLDEKTVTVISLAESEITRAAAERAAMDGRAPSSEQQGNEAQAGGQRSFWQRFRLAQLAPGQAESGRSLEEGSEGPDRTLAKKVGLEEVIVTATKRAQNIQDVPISIAVVSAEEIDRRGLVNAEDYLRGIPGANQVQGVSGQSIVIRGIETSTIFQGFSAGATSGAYFGETPTAGTAGLISSNVDIKLVDIERVEVLRGPQGTAFGSSSMGGTVRTIPVAPKLDDLEAKVAVGYSGTSGAGGDNYNAHGVINLPLLEDKLAIRAVAYTFSDSGYYRNRAASDTAFQADFVNRYNARAFASDDDEVGAYYVRGGRIAALYRASDDLKFTFSYLTQKSETDGWAIDTIGPYEMALPQVAPGHVIRGQKLGVLDVSIDIANAVVEYDLGWADLLATYSNIDAGSDLAQPNPAWGFNEANSALRQPTFKGDVGEVRIATRLDGPLNFLAGVYAENNHDAYPNEIVWFGDPATNSTAPGTVLMLNYLEQRDLKQKAAFGEVSWELLPGLTLTAGARVYDYDRVFRITQSGFFAGGSPLPTRQEAQSSGSNFRAGLSYKPHDDALLYTNWAQGFRFGRPQRGLQAATCDLDNDGLVDGTNTSIESTRIVGDDGVDSYEAGGKFTLLRGRLAVDAAVFRMDWSDLPINVGIGSGPCVDLHLANAGSARSDGVELQANFLLTDAVRMGVGGSWMHARLTKDAPRQNLFAGDRLPGSPEVNANLSLQYELDIAGHDAFIRADSIYVGSFFGDVLESPNTKSGDYVKLDLAARMMATKNLSVELYTRNVTNEDAFTFRGAYSWTSELYGYRMRPRTIGVQFSASF